MNKVQEGFELRTERLSLRRLTLFDADLMLSIWNDPAFIQHVADRGIRTIEQAQEALSQGAFKLYEDYGYGPYRVALAEDDKEIGICGLFRREGFDDPDIGYSVLPQFCGRGFAYEAASAVLHHARTDLKLTKICAFISPQNAASIGLAEKLGLKYEKAARLAGECEDVNFYSLAFDA